MGRKTVLVIMALHVRKACAVQFQYTETEAEGIDAVAGWLASYGEDSTSDVGRGTRYPQIRLPQV